MPFADDVIDCMSVPAELQHLMSDEKIISLMDKWEREVPIDVEIKFGMHWGWATEGALGIWSSN
jgi:hypothetical protein